jgi:hypothetical protein
VQELTFAKQAILFCGKRQIDFDFTAILDFSLHTLKETNGGCWWLPKVGPDSKVDLYSAMVMLSLIYYDKGPLRNSSLAQGPVLQLHRSCSEPRGVIYALLSVCKPIEVIPDYNKTVAEVYIETTRSITRQERNLDILCLSVAQDMTRLHGYLHRVSLPTWGAAL